MAVSSVKDFGGVRILSDQDQIKKELPDYSKELIRSLVIHRDGGCADSNMTAWGLHQVVGKGKVFQVSARAGLLPFPEVAAHHPGVKPLFLASGPSSSCPPRHSLVRGQWNKEIADGGEGNNALGGNGRFITRKESIEVPVIEPTPESLSYYGATLVRSGDLVSFFTKPYPIWAMTIGKNYVEKCLMSKRGGGFYFEYHHDQPHFHMPLSEDASGFYLLGREVGDQNPTTKLGSYHFTGFRIPFGSAIYTSGGAIHCDAALVGKRWLMGYTSAEDFSTVNLRTRAGRMVRIVPERDPALTMLRPSMVGFASPLRSRL